MARTELAAKHENEARLAAERQLAEERERFTEERRLLAAAHQVISCYFVLFVRMNEFLI